MNDLFRPIIGIENRTAQEVFDILCDRFRRALSLSSRSGEAADEAYVDQIAECMWQAEWARAGNGGVRRVPWSELNPNDHERYRFVARRVASIARKTPGEAPVTWQWRVLEDGEPRTAWKDPDLGDRAGWEAIAKRTPAKYAIEKRPLYTTPQEPVAAPEEARAPSVAALQAENERLRRLLEPFASGWRVARAAFRQTGRVMDDDAPMQTGFAWRDKDGATKTITWGDMRRAGEAP